MKKYKILIIGHSHFPKGTKSFLKFFGVPKESVEAFFLDNENNQEMLQKNLENFYKTNTNVITFADFSGGSPHMTAMTVLKKQGNDNQYLISSVSIGVILEVAMKTAVIGTDKNILEDLIVPSINENFNNITFFSQGQLKVNKQKNTTQGNGI